MKMEIEAGLLLDVFKGARSAGVDEGVMKFKDEYWVMKCHGDENVNLFAARAPSQCMDLYEPGGIDKLGLDFNKIENFVSSRNDTISLEAEDMTLHIEDEYTHARLATIRPDAVGGNASALPKNDHEVKYYGDFNEIMKFIDKAENVIGSDDFMMSPREEGLYLYASGDNGDLDHFKPWDDIVAGDSVSSSLDIDWSVDNQVDEDGNPKMGSSLVPSVDKGMDCKMSIDFTNNIEVLADQCQICLANHAPMKLLFDLGNGLKTSYFQAPRISEQAGIDTMPDSVIEKYQA